jgi:hypothetical protein
VPEISRFFGIVIRMLFDDHLPPHLHAQYVNRRHESSAPAGRSPSSMA